ncbi:MAG TPA: pitrilysin family protein, partial [Bacteroidota bacterium]|nr:pitrilysin family protein [Bacteroidota bacterium]
MKTHLLLFTVAILVMGLTTLLSAREEGKMKITEMRSANSPLITFRIILRAGSVNDPKGKEGLNALTAQLIAEGGTKTLTYSQVTDKLYPWAAGIGAQADQEITTFVANVHRDHLERFYKLFSDLLLRPRFDPSDFQRIKDQSINYLKNTLRATDDEDLGKQTLNASLFEGHPYMNTETGTVQGLTSITLDDVKQYYKQAYTQGNFWIGIAGGYPESFIARIKKDFAVLPAGNHVDVALPPPPAIRDMEVTIVEKPARAYAVSMGYPIPVTRKDKDFYALMVANSYFGEHRTFSGVLMNRLRGDRGLNYGDYSYIEKFVGGLGSLGVFPQLNTPLRQQYFSIWLRPIPADKTFFGIRDALFELKNLVEKGLSPSDFEATRKFVINYSKLWAATIDRRLGYQMDSEFYDSPYFIDRIEQELKSLTV